MTVEIKSQKSKTDLVANDAASKAPGLKDILNVDPLQQGQALQAASKKRKKQQKRAGLYKILVSVQHHFVCGEIMLLIVNKSTSIKSGLRETGSVALWFLFW